MANEFRVKNGIFSPNIGTESGDFTIDSAGDIIFDADGTDILLKDGGTAFGSFKRASSDFIIKAEDADNDIIFKGIDGSSTITALTLDMSEAGTALFGHDVTLLNDAAVLGFGADTDVTLTHVADTGLLLNDAMQLRFRDSAINIGSSTNGQMDINADGSIVATSQVVALAGTTGIAVQSPSVVFGNTTSASTVVQIKDEVNDASSGELRFVKDKGAAGADGDDIGKITFVGDDAGQTQTNFGQILVEVSEADNTDEAGKMSLLVAESDGTTTALTAGLVLEGEHATDGQVDVTIAAGAASTTTIAGNLTITGSTTTIGGSDALVAGAQTAITTDFNTGRKVGRDTHNLIDFTTDNEITFRASNSNQLVLTDNSLQPSSDNSFEIGDTGTRLKSLVVATSAGTNEYFAVGTTNNANNMALLRTPSTPKFELFTWENAETTDGTRVSMKAFHNSQGTHGMILKSEITVNTSSHSGQSSEYFTSNGPIHFEGHDDTYGFWAPISAPSSGQMGALLIAKTDYRSELSGVGTPPQSQLEVRSPAGGPGTLTLSTEEATVVDGDKLGRIDFNAPKESDGTDAIAIAASIWAEADDTFAADNNSTDLVFATGASEAATEKMRLTHDGYLLVGKTAGEASIARKLEVDGTIAAVDTGASGGIGFHMANSEGEFLMYTDGGALLVKDYAGSDTYPFKIVGAASTDTLVVNTGGAVAVSGALTVGGNLTVNGTTTTVDTATLAVEDPLIILASGNDAADTVDIGFYGLYDTSGSQDLYAGLYRDATDGKFHLFKDLQAAPTTTVNQAGTGYAVATLVANIEGNITTATTATTATNVVVTDNESTNEDNAIIFAAGADVDGSTSIGLESDGNFTYNPSSAQVSAGMLQLTSTTSDQFKLNYDGDDKFALHVGTDRAKFRYADTGGTLKDVMVFYENGTSVPNVGINVTSPSSILHVKEASTINSVANSARMIVAADGGDSYIHLMESTDGHNIRHTASDNSLRFRSTLAGSDLMTLTSGGNLGIGETTPAFPLEVNGFISTASGIVHMGDTNNTISFGTDTQSFNTAGSARMTIAADGAVNVVGAFSAATKSFDIEHPTKEGKRLHHGSLEGPEHGVYHRGVGSSRVVDLPDYWTGLVDEDSITVQITPKGQFQSLYVSKIEGNRVYVDSDHGEPLDFYFNVYGERKDVDKLVVEY